MALPKQHISLPLIAGVDTKTDPRQLDIGQWEVLENVRYTSPRRAKKALGFDPLTKEVNNEPDLAAAFSVSSFENSPILLDSEDVYRYSSDLDKWVNLGEMVPAESDEIPLVAANLNIFNIVYAENSGFSLSCFKETASNFTLTTFPPQATKAYYQISTTSGTPVITKTEIVPVETLNSIGDFYALTVGDFLVIVYDDPTAAFRANVKYIAYDATDFTAPPVTGTIFLTSGTRNRAFHAIAANNRIYVANSLETSGPTSVGYQIVYLDTILTQSSTLYVENTSDPNREDIRQISLNIDNTNDLVWVVCYHLEQDWYYWSSVDLDLIGLDLSPVGTAGNTIQLVLPSNGWQSGWSVTWVDPANEYMYFMGRGLCAARFLMSTGAFDVPIPPFGYSLADFSKTGFISGIPDPESNISQLVFRELLCKPFLYKNNWVYVYGFGGYGTAAIATSQFFNEQKAVYVSFWDQKGALAKASVFNSTAGRLATKDVYPLLTGDLTLKLPLLNVVDFEAEAGVIEPTVGGELLTLTMGSSVRPPDFLELASNLLITDNTTKMVDGVSVTEHGFLNRPYFVQISVNFRIPDVSRASGNPTIGIPAPYQGVFLQKVIKPGMTVSGSGIPVGTQVSGVGINLTSFTMTNPASTTGTGSVTLSGGGLTSGASYLYYATYEWFDFQGNKHISAPSDPARLTPASPNTGFFLRVAVLPETYKTTGGRPIAVNIYRTLANATIPYKVNTLYVEEGLFPNGMWYDDQPDAGIVGNEILYIASGEVDNSPLPESTFLSSYKARAIGVRQESSSFWYSKQVLPGGPVRFSDFFEWNVDPVDGPVRAAVEMDDKLVIFKDRSLYYLVGNGPSVTGANNSFSEPVSISAEVGCPFPLSIVVTSIGLMFKTLRGIYLLNRGLGTEYIGAPVERYNDLTITGSLFLPDFNEVRFFTEEGTTLVFDTFLKQWYTRSDQEVVAATLSQNTPVYVDATAGVWIEGDGYTDDGAAINRVLETGWMSFDQVEGFQRVYKMLIMGEYKSPHELTVEVFTDFNDALPSQTQIIVPLPDQPYEYRLFFTRQKTTSVKVRITETVLAPFGEGMELSALTFEVGVKAGVNKLPADKSF